MPAITVVGRSIVLDHFQQDRPQISGARWENWCHKVSELTGLTVGQVKSIVADEASSILLAVRQDATTHAQKIAHMLGATTAKAIAVFNEAMDAEDVSVLKDRHGDPVRDKETGELI
jgi:hypothetical protein